MKKYYFFFGILGLLVGYFSKSDFWFEDGRETFFPISKEQLKKKKAAESKPDTTAAPVDKSGAPVSAESIRPQPVVNLESLSQSELFHELYNSKVLSARINQSIYFEKIKSRLTSRYPPAEVSDHRTAYEKEVSNRMGILKAMSQFWPSPREVVLNQLDLKKFFFEIASNKSENLMVRRQAYKNWLSFGNTISSVEKSRLLASADSKLTHLISLSDETLIQALTERAE